MPMLDGLALTRRIRTSPDAQLRRLPIVALSGTAEEDTAKAVGVNAYRLKTDHPEALLATIGRLLSQVPRPAPSPPAPPAFDLGPAAIKLGLPPARLAELFEGFQAEYRDSPAALRRAVSAGDTSVLRAQAHRLKGTAALLCAEPLREAAEALENACRDDRTEALEDLTADLAMALEALLAA